MPTHNHSRVLSSSGVLLVSLMATLLAACQPDAPPFVCTDAIGCVDIGPGEPIQVGVLQVLSGDVAPFGVEQVRAIEIAIAERGNRLLDHPIELQIEDSLCSTEGGTNAALKVATVPQIVAVLGTTCSGAAAGAINIVSEAGMVMVSGTNTAPSLTAIAGKQGDDWQPGYFRTAHNDTVQGRAAAIFAFWELGVRKAATINDGDVFTKGLAAGFNQVFTEFGGEIVLAAAVNKGDVNMRPVLTAVAESGAELVFLPLFEPEGNRIVLQARAVAGLEEIILLAGAALLVDSFVKDVGAGGVGLYFVGPDTPRSPAYQALVTAYKKKYDVAPTTSRFAHAYDAANMVMHAIEEVAVQEEDGTLHIGRQALRQALSNTSDYPGLTGSLSCDEFGDCGVAKFKIMRLDDPTAGIEGLTANVVYTYSPNQ